MENITGKNVLITGGSKGIGYGIAAILLEKGLNVALTSRSQAAADEAVKQLSGINPSVKVMGIAADVRDLNAMERVAGEVTEAFGSLDVTIANAGIGKFDAIEDLSPKDWNDTIDINLTGVFNTVKATIPALKKSKGYIITIASLAGTNFFTKGAAYNASKFGLVGFSQSIMLDLRQYGVKVTTIMPGSVTSYFNDHVPNEKDAWKIQPEDLGEMVVDLLEMHPRTLPSKIEVRPSMPPSK